MAREGKHADQGTVFGSLDALADMIGVGPKTLSDNAGAA